MDPSALFAFSLGPIETREGPGLVFLGFRDGQLLGPTRAHDPEHALAELAALVPAGTPLHGLPDLVHAAPGAGFRSMRAPDEVLALRAQLAMVLEHGRHGPQAEGELRSLIRAAARFWMAHPWDRLPADEALVVEVRGAFPRVYECTILGEAGEEYGLALYPEPGSVRRVVELARRDQPEGMRRIDLVSLTLTAEPAWACRAVEAWCGMPLVPIAFGLTRSRIRSITAREALVLAATLDATAGMQGVPDEEGTGTAGEIEVSVRMPSGL